ncbi:MAG: OprD family outer membrane porin [Sulfurospirillaceae bacterium]|nr:OprD family outer membrane porin [Sulfurospirillaceae bacterium]
MKLIKLGAITLVILGLSGNVSAAQTLESAFKDGKIDGTLKAFYFNRNNQNTPSNITDLGIVLNYITASYKGFNAGFSAEGASTQNINENGKTAFNDDMYGTGAVLSQAYVKYTISDAYFKVGRQYIDTPLVANDDSRIVKDSFEGFVASYSGIKNTILTAVYISKFQDRSNKNGSIGTFENISNASSNDGAWSVALTSAIDKFELTAAYLQVIQNIGDISALYAEGIYHTKYDTSIIDVAVQYFQGKDKSDTTGSNDGNTYAFQISSSFDKLSAYIAYSHNSKDKATFAGIGNGSGPLYTAAPIAEANFDANYQITVLNLEYALSNELSAYLFYSHDHLRATDTITTSSYDIYSIGASYAFPRTLKGLNTTLQYEIKDYKFSEISNDKEFRVKIKYNF